MYSKKHKQTAQLIIITAFVLALTFLLLATLLNIVIYSENQASRGVAVADQAAFETHTDVNKSVKGLLKEDNFNNYSRSYDERQNSVTRGIEHIFNVNKIKETKNQRLYNGTITETENGTRIIQDSNRNFTNQYGTENWIVVDSTENTRNMTQTVERNSLHQAPNKTVWSVPGYMIFNSMFRTEFDTSSGTWVVYFVEDVSTNTIYLRTENPSGSFYNDCAISSSQATVNYSEQTVGNQDCPALDFVTELNNPYQIRYINSDEVEGQYHIHTSAELGSGVPDYQYNSVSSQDSPYAVRSIYSVEYKQLYISEEVEYDVSVYVAPNQLENESV